MMLLSMLLFPASLLIMLSSVLMSNDAVCVVVVDCGVGVVICVDEINDDVYDGVVVVRTVAVPDVTVVVVVIVTCSNCC